MARLLSREAEFKALAQSIVTGLAMHAEYGHLRRW